MSGVTGGFPEEGYPSVYNRSSAGNLFKATGPGCEDIWPDRTLQPLSELFLFYELEKPGSGDKLECGG